MLQWWRRNRGLDEESKRLWESLRKAESSCRACRYIEHSIRKTDLLRAGRKRGSCGCRDEALPSLRQEARGMNDWLDGISIEDLPPQYREMAEIVGLENTLKLAEHFGKSGFYFRSLEPLIARKKEEYIRKNFNGRNHRELARRTGYSERWVYEILKRKEEQPDMFTERYRDFDTIKITNSRFKA